MRYIYLVAEPVFPLDLLEELTAFTAPTPLHDVSFDSIILAIGVALLLIQGLLVKLTFHRNLKLA